MSFANNAATTLASGINTSVTSLTVASGTGTLFPTLTGSQYFYCTLENSAGTSREIVKVTARSTDTFTIARGQDGTTGTAFSTGDRVELRLVRANLTDFALLGEVNTFSQQPTFSSGIKFADATTQTTTAVPGVLGQVFTASGTFTIPTGVTALKVTVVGGGGGGGAGGGAFHGNAGGTSSVSSGTQAITTVSATGGGGGIGGGGAGAVTVGGVGSGGALNFQGKAGTYYISGSISNGGDAALFYGLGAIQTGTGIGADGSLYGGGGAGNGVDPDQGGGGGGAAIQFFTGLTPANTLSVTVGAGAVKVGTTYAGGAGGAGVVIVEW